MPFVYLEGAHGAGKSTLAGEIAALAVQDGWRTLAIHNGIGESFPALLDAKREFILNHHRNIFVIFDRWFVSEYVYHITENRNSTLGELSFFDACMRWLQPIVAHPVRGIPVLLRYNDSIADARLYEQLIRESDFSPAFIQAHRGDAKRIYKFATYDKKPLRWPYTGTSEQDLYVKGMYGLRDLADEPKESMFKEILERE